MENHSSEPMPIAPGFHPYFAVTQSEKADVVTSGPPGFATHAFDWVQHIPDNPYPLPHQVTLQLPRGGTLTMSELPQDGSYALANMQVWSEPTTRPDHDFICFEPTVGSEDALNRPADRLNIATRSTGKIVLQLRAQPRHLEIRNQVGESGEDGLAKVGRRLSRGADPSTSSNSSKEKTP